MAVGRPITFGNNAVGKSQNTQVGSRGFFEDAAQAVGKFFSPAVSWLKDQVPQAIGAAGHYLADKLPSGFGDAAHGVSSGISQGLGADKILGNLGLDLADNAKQIGGNYLGPLGAIAGGVVQDIFGRKRKRS